MRPWTGWAWPCTTGTLSLIPEASKFADQLTGTYGLANGEDSLLPDF